MTNYKEDYLGVLDGVRGCMAFWVFYYHIKEACAGRGFDWGSGALAVDVFMWLSGFLMAYHWLLRKDRFDCFRNQARDFYIRRFFRIAPLYYLLLTIALLGQHSFFGARDYAMSVFPPSWAKDLPSAPVRPAGSAFLNALSHYTFVFGLSPQYASSNILPDWSIGLEMQFYLILPFLMMAIIYFGAFSVVLVSMTVAHLTNMWVGLYLHTGLLGNYGQPTLILFKIHIFASGICIAFAFARKGTLKKIAWLILGMVALSQTAYQVQFCVFFITFLLFFDPKRGEFFHKLVSGPFAKFLGDTSYSVYLVHPLVLWPVLALLCRHDWFVRLDSHLRLPLLILLVGLPVYALGFILFRLVELPGIEMGRRILSRFSGAKR